MPCSTSGTNRKSQITPKPPSQPSTITPPKVSQSDRMGSRYLRFPDLRSVETSPVPPLSHPPPHNFASRRLRVTPPPPFLLFFPPVFDSPVPHPHQRRAHMIAPHPPPCGPKLPFRPSPPFRECAKKKDRFPEWRGNVWAISFQQPPQVYTARRVQPPLQNFPPPPLYF